MPPKEPPKVTGLSPMSGPPGTKITIRGENLGVSGNDILGLTICGCDCLPYLEWKSSSKLFARSRSIGTGDIIVSTRSGGLGSCTVQFCCYEEIVSPTKESAVWVEETDYPSMMGVNKRPSISPSVNDTQLNDILGLYSKQSNNSYSPDRSHIDYNLERFFPGTMDSKVPEYVNPLSQNFIPIWYLVNNYSSINLNDLKRSYKSLKIKTKSLDQTQQHTFDEDFDMPNRSNNDSFDRIAFLKSNILAIIECLQVLKKLHMAFLKDKKENGPDLTCEVQSYIKNALTDAHNIFDSILAKKDLVDSTRNALNILQRQRFLFNLPSSIEKSIQRSDYDVVINEFANAQSLFANTEVSVFKRVYREVETKIKELHVMLEKKLFSTCQTASGGRNIDDVKKLIRHLMCLDNNKKNHAWDSIVRIRESLITSIDECHQKYLDLAQQQQINKKSSKGIDDDMNKNILTDYDDQKITQNAPYVVQFVQEATSMFNDNFQDLYRLGQAYFNDEFPIDEPEELRQQKELEFGQEMIAKSILHLCDLLRLALVPDSVKLQDRSPVWPSKVDGRYVYYLRHVLRCIINCRSKLNKIELPIYTRSALEDFKDFVFELRAKSMRVLFEQAANDTKSLYAKESWEIIVDDSFGGRTQLPLLFEKKVVEVLQLAKETIFQTTSSDETAIFTRIDVQATMKQLAQNLIQAFSIALDTALASNAEFPAETYHNLIASKGSNQIFPRLRDQFEKLQYPDMNLVMKKCHDKYFNYEKKIFDKYCKEKSIEVFAGLKKAISASSRKPNTINYHIQDCQMNLFEVQSQVFLVAPPLVNKIMDYIIDETVIGIENTSNQHLKLDDQPTQEMRDMLNKFLIKIRRTHVN